MGLGYKPLITSATGIYVGIFLRNLLALYKEKGRPVDPSTPNAVGEMVRDSAIKIGEGDIARTVKVSVDFLRSNLGANRGYVYYFVCNNCKRRARYLYATQYLQEALCRKCQMLVYPKQKESDKRIRNLLNNPELLQYTLQSPRLNDNLLALKASYIKEELEEQARNEVDKGRFKGL